MSGLVSSSLNMASYLAAGINISSKKNRDIISSLTLINSVRQIGAIERVQRSVENTHEDMLEGFNEVVSGLDNIDQNISSLRTTTEIGFNVLYQSSLDVQAEIEKWGAETVNAINLQRQEALQFYKESLINDAITHKKLDRANELLELNLAEQVRQTIALENPDQARSIEKLNTALKTIKLFGKNADRKTLQEAINYCEEAISLDEFNEAALCFSAKWLNIMDSANFSDGSKWKERYIESKNKTLIELDNPILSQKEFAEDNAKRLSISAPVDLINNLEFELFRKEFYTFAKKYIPEEYLIDIEVFNFYSLCFSNDNEKTYRHFQRSIKKFGFSDFFQAVMENKIAIAAILRKNPAIITTCLIKFNSSIDDKIDEIIKTLTNQSAEYKNHLILLLDDIEDTYQPIEPRKFKSLESFRDLGDSHYFNIFSWGIDSQTFNIHEIIRQKRENTIQSLLEHINKISGYLYENLKYIKNRNDELQKACANFKKEFEASYDFMHKVTSGKSTYSNQDKFIKDLEKSIKRNIRFLGQNRSRSRVITDKLHSKIKNSKDIFQQNILALIKLTDALNYEDIQLPSEFYELQRELDLIEKSIDDSEGINKLKLHNGEITPENIIEAAKNLALEQVRERVFIYKIKPEFWALLGIFVWWWLGTMPIVGLASIGFIGYKFYFSRLSNRLSENLVKRIKEFFIIDSKLDNLISDSAEIVIERMKRNGLVELSEKDLLAYPEINNYLRIIFEISQEQKRSDQIIDRWNRDHELFLELKDAVNFENILVSLNKLKKQFLKT